MKTMKCTSKFYKLQSMIVQVQFSMQTTAETNGRNETKAFNKQWLSEQRKVVRKREVISNMQHKMTRK